MKLTSISNVTINGDSLRMDIIAVPVHMSWDSEGQEVWTEGTPETMWYVFRADDPYGLSPQIKTHLQRYKANFAPDVQDWIDEYLPE